MLHFRFFFMEPATTESYTYGHTLSLHDALPICRGFPVPSESPSPENLSLAAAVTSVSGRWSIAVGGVFDFPSRLRRRGPLSASHKAARGPAFAGATIKTKRSEEHTSELQSLMRISYAVFCLKKKQTHPTETTRRLVYITLDKQQIHS